MKKIIEIIAFVFLLGVIIYVYQKPKVETIETKDVKNISYIIDGKNITLKNGVAEIEIAPNSNSKQIVRIFGEPVVGDLTGDKINDSALLLTVDKGGSGIFYYAVLAIHDGENYKSTNTLFLGDRIAPQNINIIDGRAVYNYTERKINEPMTTRPSMGKSLYIHYDKKTGNIGEWVKDFEGEADPDRMSLGVKKWEWVKTQMNDGKEIVPKKSDVFTLSFNKNNQLQIGTDCNQMGAVYNVNENKIVFSQMISTMMYCEGSQEAEFSKSLNEVESFLFTSKGELILQIKVDSGSMIFR